MTRKVKEPRQLAFDEIVRAPQAKVSFAIDEFFPEELADELARQEAFNKHLFRPNTYLHKRWARRCGSTFRSLHPEGKRQPPLSCPAALSPQQWMMFTTQ